MNNSKEKLKETIATLYEEGKRENEIRSWFDSIISQKEMIYTAQDTVVAAILNYIDKVYPDMRQTYSKEDIMKFAKSAVFDVINADVESLRTLKAAGYEKVPNDMKTDDSVLQEWKIRL